MTFVHKTVRIREGETLSIPDGDILVGNHIEQDGKGGWLVVAHILEPATELVNPLNSQQQRAQ